VVFYSTEIIPLGTPGCKPDRVTEVSKGIPDPMRSALSYAILAPNPHNRQCWAVNLKSSTEAVLICDLRLLLPDTDPFSRQIDIGSGC